MKNIHDNVLFLLHHYPDLRDNKGELSRAYFIEYWEFSRKGVREDMLDFISSNIQEAIGRSSRMIQNKYPELRGEKWRDRQSHAKKIRQKIRSQERPEDKKKWWNIFS